MAAKRVDAALLVNARGELSGIMTDNDLTRRVVSQDINVSVCVKGVMTKQPKCVNSEDPALDALELMVENRFRHLPVLDKNGAVVGLLDIAKCLYDAISALEKVQTEDDDSAVSSEALAGLMTGAMQKAAGGRGGNKAQLAAMQAMISQMFGGSVPTLRTIIGDSEFVSVSPRATVFEASKAMAEVRKGVLVMDDDDLAGIFTPKDLLNRVIAKGLSPRDIVVSDVMTPNPDCVGPDLTLLDALREMHDQKYLHLPVRDDNGNVLGLVDVMELVCHTAGGDDEGGKGWRDFFSSAMNARGDEEGSELSFPVSNTMPPVPRQPRKLRGDQRPVSRLRPKVPLIVSDNASILAVCEQMTKKRSDAALLVNSKGKLAGILTDNDLTRRVISKFVDIKSSVKDVMTKQPKCVNSEDPALDALELMVENRFRHLPVLDKNGAVVGLLDIAKCLYDAISALEKVQTEDGDSAVSSEALAGLMTGAMKKAAGGRGGNMAQLAAMQAMISKMFGSTVPTLRKYLKDKKLSHVRPSINVREACCVMTKARKGLLVMEEDELVGIFTPREVLKKVICRGKPPDITAVSSVMVTSPHSVSPNLTLLEALREMYENKASYLVVEDDGGTVFGLVDAMELVCHTAGGDSSKKGWRDFFKRAMNARVDDLSDISSKNSDDVVATSCTVTPQGRPAQALRENDNYSDVFSIGLMTEVPVIPSASVSNLSAAGNHDSASVMTSKYIMFKIVDSKGNFHRIQCKSQSISTLRSDVARLLMIDENDSRIILKYMDEDDDEVVINTDAALLAAVDYGRSCLKNTIKLIVIVEDLPPSNFVDEDVAPARPPFLTSPSSVNQPDVNSDSPPNQSIMNSEKSNNSDLKQDGNSTKLIVLGGLLAALATIGFVYSRRNK